MKLLRIYDAMLLEDFKTQKKRFIQQGIGPDIVNSYIEKFKHIKNQKYKEIKHDIEGVDVDIDRRVDIDAYKDFHELERVVDYVSGQRNVSTSMGGTELEVSGKAIFEDNSFEVYYADSPRACVKYKGKIPYSWCISRSDSANMFYTYRFKPYEPAFYFIKDKKAAEKEFKAWNMTKNVFKGQFSNKYHFFVLQVPKNINPDDNDAKQYIVSSANNDGDRQMSWNELLELNPKLSSIKEVLEPKPFTPEEREQHQRFRNGINDREFSRLSYEEKKDYLDIYPTIGRAISYEQLKALPDDLMNLYASFGIGFDGMQHNFVVQHKPKILKRYINITHRKYDEYMAKDGYQRNQLQLNYSEIRTLKDHDITTYLQTLSDTELNVLVHDNEDMDFEFIKRHRPEKFDKEDVSIIELIRKAASGDDEAEETLNEMIPTANGLGLIIKGDKITIETRGWKTEKHKATEKFDFEEDLRDLFNHTQTLDGYYTDYYYYSDSHFEGWEEGLDDEYNSIIKQLFDTLTEEKEDVLSLGLKWNETTIKELLDVAGKVEDIRNKIDSEFSTAENDAKQKAAEIEVKKFHRIIEIDDDDIMVSTRAFIMFLHSHEFFTNDIDEFETNIVDMVDALISGYGLPYGYYDLQEQIDNDSHNYWDLDADSIIEEATSELQNAIEAYANDNYDEEDDEDDEDDSKMEHLKRKVVKLLRTTLSGMGEDPNVSEIDNELVHITIDRNRLNMNGKVWVRIRPLGENSWENTKSGYVNITDLPTYYTNYRLFETIQRFKGLI